MQEERQERRHHDHAKEHRCVGAESRHQQRNRAHDFRSSNEKREGRRITPTAKEALPTLGLEKFREAGESEPQCSDNVQDPQENISAPTEPSRLGNHISSPVEFAIQDATDYVICVRQV